MRISIRQKQQKRRLYFCIIKGKNVDRITIEKSRIILKFDELRELVKKNGEISIQELSDKFKQSKPVIEGWIKYLIGVQCDDALILMNGVVTTKQYNGERNKLEKIADSDVDELYNKVVKEV